MTTWDVELVKIDQLVLDPENPRRMAPEMGIALRRSVERFGNQRAVIARRSDRRVIGGHQLIRVLKELGEEVVPVKWWEGTDEEARAFNIALNAIDGEFTDKLGLQLAELADVQTLSDALHGFDTSLTELTGFDTRAVLSLIAGALPSNPHAEDLSALARDLSPVADRTSRTQRGFLYLLGAHRLLCGDATDPDDVHRLCPGPAAMLFSDPPYRVSYSAEASPGRAASSGRPGGRRARPLGRIAGDDLAPAAYAELLETALQNAAAVLAPGAAVYLCGGTSTTSEYDRALELAGIEKTSIVVWDKGSHTFGRRDYQSQFELIWYAYRSGGAHRFFGGRTQTDLWTIPRDPGALYVHPTQKPVELAERAIKNSTLPGEVVLDLFGGSGSTLIAAERTGRQACLMEIAPHFVDVVVSRWEAFTGRHAELVVEDGADHA